MLRYLLKSYKKNYYYALLSYGNQCQFKKRKEMDRYHKTSACNQ